MTHFVKNYRLENSAPFHRREVRSIKSHQAQHREETSATANPAWSCRSQNRPRAVYRFQCYEDDHVIDCLVHCRRIRTTGTRTHIERGRWKVSSDDRLPFRNSIVECCLLCGRDSGEKSQFDIE